MINIGDTVWVISQQQNATVVDCLVDKDGKTLYNVRMKAPEVLVTADDVTYFHLDDDKFHLELIEEFESTI